MSEFPVIDRAGQMKKLKKIRGHAEVHAEASWVDRGDGARERVIDAFRVEHRDGSVEFASSPEEALAKIAALDDRARRRAERRDPGAQVLWITTIVWNNCGPGFEPPAMEVKS